MVSYNYKFKNYKYLVILFRCHCLGQTNLLLLSFFIFSTTLGILWFEDQCVLPTSLPCQYI